MRSMRTVAGLLNVALGVALALGVSVLINLGWPANAVALTVGGLMVLAGIGTLARASWGASLGLWLGVGGILLGLALLVGAAVAPASVPERGDLAGAALIALGVPVLLASVLAFLVNRRTRRSASDL